MISPWLILLLVYPLWRLCVWVLKQDMAGDDGEPLAPAPRPILRVSELPNRPDLETLTPAMLRQLVTVGTASTLISPRGVELPLGGRGDWSSDDILVVLCEIEAL
jgi:hypothetical protein